jgi:streptogramin lyase
VWLANAGPWATEDDGEGLARLDPDSGEVRAIPVPHASTYVVSGFGSIWSIGGGDGAVPEGNITRIDPLTRRVDAVIGYDDGEPWSPTDIVVGPEAVWVADQYRGAVLRIDPETNTMAVAATVASGPTRIAAVGDLIYVTTLDHEVLEVGPGGQVETVATGSGIAAGADGRLWVSDSGANQVALLEPGRPEPVATISGRTGRLESDRQGGVWVAGDGWVEHFDADGLAVPGSRIEVADVWGMGASADGSVWLSAYEGQEVRWWGAPAGGTDTVLPPARVTLLSNGIDVRDGFDHKFVHFGVGPDDVEDALSWALGPPEELATAGMCIGTDDALRWGPVLLEFVDGQLAGWNVTDSDGEPDEEFTVGLGVWPGMPVIEAELDLAGVTMVAGPDGRVESLSAGCV